MTLSFQNHHPTWLYCLINLVTLALSKTWSQQMLLWYWTNPIIRNFWHRAVSLFHINACSINKKLWYLNILLKCTNKTFNIIALTETRITAKTFSTYNINLNNYSYETTLRGSSTSSNLLNFYHFLHFTPSKAC